MNPLQYSCLENAMDRGAWQATFHGVARVRHNLATKSPPKHIYQCIHTHTHMHTQTLLLLFSCPVVANSL